MRHFCSFSSVIGNEYPEDFFCLLKNWYLLERLSLLHCSFRAAFVIRRKNETLDFKGLLFLRLLLVRPPAGPLESIALKQQYRDQTTKETARIETTAILGVVVPHSSKNWSMPSFASPKSHIIRSIAYLLTYMHPKIQVLSENTDLHFAKCILLKHCMHVSHAASFWFSKLYKRPYDCNWYHSLWSNFNMEGLLRVNMTYFLNTYTI